MNETIGLVLIVIGVLFDLLGCIGLVRLPDIYNRIQASTKCVVLGTTLSLLGAMVPRSHQGSDLHPVCANYILNGSACAGACCPPLRSPIGGRERG